MLTDIVICVAIVVLWKMFVEYAKKQDHGGSGNGAR